MSSQLEHNCPCKTVVPAEGLWDLTGKVPGFGRRYSYPQGTAMGGGGGNPYLPF